MRIDQVADPVRVLCKQVRRDIGRFPSLTGDAEQALRAQYGQHTGH
jgi:hypothetical protein